MGVLSSPQACKQITIMMKNVAVVALCLFAAAAVAEPEADAGYHYGHLGYAHHGYYGYPYGHDAYYGYGYGHLGYAHHGYYGYPYAHHGYYGHHYGKRSADAEPKAAAEADAY